MNFRDSVGYCMYNIYNWLAIYYAPIWVLDLIVDLFLSEKIDFDFVWRWKIFALPQVR